MTLREHLFKQNLQLPEISSPGGNYQSLNIRGNIAHIAIQFPILNGKYLYQGQLGREITTEEGYEAMKLCALNVLAHLDRHIPFEKIIGLNHIEACFQSSSDWDDSPLIVNGASDLFVKLLEDRGKHSRTIFGVERLPRNFCVGLTASVTIESIF